MYQRMGLVNDYFGECGRPLTDADNGRYNVTHDEADRHRFKVPSLRNVALTAPYFHDGSRADLTDAVRTMAHYQLNRDLSDGDARSATDAGEHADRTADDGDRSARAAGRSAQLTKNR
jgi:cytochrome c peroxidase